MRLICPSCGAQYEVDDALIPEDGRDVQCTNCGTGWFQQPPALGSDLADALGTDAALNHLPEQDPEDEDGELPPPGEPVRSARPGSHMDASIRSILMEEAAREARARRGEPLAEAQDAADLDPRVRPVAQRPEPEIPGLDPRPQPFRSEAAPQDALSIRKDPAPAPKPELPISDIAAATAPAPADPASNSARVPQPERPQPAPRPEQAPLPQTLPRPTHPDKALGPQFAPAVAVQPVQPHSPTKAEPPQTATADSPALESAPEPARAEDLLAEASAASRAIPPANAVPLAASAPKPVPAAVTSRRDLLPDIEEINSALRSADEISAEAEAAEQRPTRGGFGFGFMAVVVVVLIAVLIYAFAERLGAALPAQEPWLKSYVEAVNALRIWLDQRAQALLAALRG